jgi:hypothetical protein
MVGSSFCLIRHDHPVTAGCDFQFSFTAPGYTLASQLP